MSASTRKRFRGLRGWVVAGVVLIVGLGSPPALRAWARTGPVRKELLQSKVGGEYAVSILRLRLRDPIGDARGDLAAGDRGLYCVGTYACAAPGISGAVPEGMSVHATATVGCIVDGGVLGMAYGQEEERYLAAYNAAKIAAARGEPD